MTRDPKGRPDVVTIDGSTIDYAYTTSGMKLSSETTDANGNTSTIFYYGPWQVRDGHVYSLEHSEGRVVFEAEAIAQDQRIQFQYYLRDYLGSTRVVLRDRFFDDRDLMFNAGNAYSSTPPTNYMLEATDYYPFGMPMEEPDVPSPTFNHRSTYTGQEMLSEADLNWMDYGARWYDPQLGLFGSVDPLASSFPSYTPYHYVHNNPINLIDPTGMNAESYNAPFKQSQADMVKDDCCDFGGAARDLKKVVLKKYPEAVKTLADVVMSVIPDEGNPDAEDFHDSGDSQSSGSENVSSMETNSNGVIDSPDATDGADNIVEFGPSDMPGGGGIKDVNPVRRVGGTLNKTMPHAVDDKPDTTYVRNFGACGECKTDTIITHK